MTDKRRKSDDAVELIENKKNPDIFYSTIRAYGRKAKKPFGQKIIRDIQRREGD